MSTLYITGIGPGSDAFLTNEARTAIEQSDVICGYTIYVDLLRSRYPDREFITTPMRQEIERWPWSAAGMPGSTAWPVPSWK